MVVISGSSGLVGWHGHGGWVLPLQPLVWLPSTTGLANRNIFPNVTSHGSLPRPNRFLQENYCFSTLSTKNVKIETLGQALARIVSWAHGSLPRPIFIKSVIGFLCIVQPGLQGVD